MEGILQFIQDKAPFLIEHIYIFLFLGGALEGLNTIILAGFLSSFDRVNIVIAFPLMVVAHMTNGFMWYLVGYLGGAKSLDKWGHKNKVSHNVINKISKYFQRYSSKAIMFARISFSFDIATMILSGSLKYDIKKFAKYCFLGSFVWVLMTFFMGYFFGQGFQLLFTKVIKNTTFVIVFLGGAIALIYIISSLLKKYFVGYLTLTQKLKDWRFKTMKEIDKILGNGKDGN